MKCNDRTWGVEQLLALLIYISGTALLYYLIFSNPLLLRAIFNGRGYAGALYVLIVILLASTLYGNAVSILMKHTLEKAIDKRVIRRG